MNRRSIYRNEKGYTLVEIVMVIVILGVIGAFTFQFVAHGVQAFKKSSARKDLYDQGRLALERMVRELRDAKEVTGSTGSSVTFKKAHPSQAADNTEEIKFQLNGINLERVGDPNGTPATAVLASNVTSFTVTDIEVTGGGGGGLCAISFDAATPATSCDYCASVTFQHTVGNGTNRLLVVTVGLEHDPGEHTVSGVTYGGQGLTKIRGDIANPGSTEAHAELWYLLNPPSGAANVVVSTGGGTSNVRNLHAGAISLEDVAQQAPEANAGNNLIGAGPISTNISTVTNNAWLIDAVTCGNTGSYTPDSGQTERHDISYNSSSHAGGTRGVAVAGATAEQWTHSGANRLAHAVAAFAPATGCGGGGGGTVDQRISFDEDDSEEAISSGSIDWTSSDLELGEEGSPQIVGMRWRNVTIPQGATIASAYIEFTADEVQTGTPVNLTFKGEDADNAVAFQNVAYDISTRTPTSASVSWDSVPAWSTVGETHQSPDISPIIQEIVNRTGWASGNALVVLVTGSGRRTADSHDSSPTTAALLNVLTGGSLATLEITLTDPNDSENFVTMRTKVYLRNLP